MREEELFKDGSTFLYIQSNGLLYWKRVALKHNAKVGELALLFPKDCRPLVLSVGHENPLLSTEDKYDNSRQVLPARYSNGQSGLLSVM